MRRSTSAPWGGEVRFLDCVKSELALRVAGRIGRVLPAYATSLGKVILAQLPTDTVLRLHPGESLAPVTPHTIRRRSQLLAELDHVRERGYAVNHDESEEGVSFGGGRGAPRRQPPTRCPQRCGPHGSTRRTAGRAGGPVDARHGRPDPATGAHGVLPARKQWALTDGAPILR
ncbi:IclR family transcriptional regulator C-terminal domain-containing protein [Streptomyces sp. NPDC096311]|uniref:IclR family transcriptional regulator domain-containing protein n=1 Tax=Streptomyces sp. NPDC096311 TaxID=3366083 RepID=UPI003823DC1C